MDHLTKLQKIKYYSCKINDLTNRRNQECSSNNNKVRFKHSQKYRDSLKAKAMVYQSEINECKIYISLLGG